MLYTDGAQFLAEQGGAYWLLDIIAIAQQHEPRVAQDDCEEMCEYRANDRFGKDRVNAG